MKKLLLFLILLVPFTVKADEGVEQLYINAKIQENGDLFVEELFVLDGESNGYGREILYSNPALNNYDYMNFEHSSLYNASAITDLKVSAKFYKEDITFNTFKDSFNYFTEISSANVGDSEVYTINNTYNGVDLKIYFPSSGARVIHYISYTLKDVVLMHEDGAEVYWQFIGNEFLDDAKEVQIKLLLPTGVEQDIVRTWVHGNLSGEWQPIIEKGLQIGSIAMINDLKAGAGVDMRMFFPSELVDSSAVKKHSATEAEKEILEVEEVRAEEANKQRANIRFWYYFFISISVIYIAGLIAIWICVYKKYDKEHKSNFSLKYYREFIEDYDVEVIDYLFNKKITPNAMSASIMNLIYKKNIEAVEIESKKKVYKFTLLNKDNISPSEDYLIEFLFTKVGSDNEFTTKDLKKYASSNATYSKFTTNYTTWQNKVTNEGNKQNFFESNTKIKLLGSLYAVLGFLIFFFAISKEVEILLPYFLMLPAVIFFFYIILFNKRTKKGNEDYVKWKAFKNFLLDFSILPQRELPEIVIWERYMVYATVLGVAKKVQQAMNVRIKEFDTTNMTYTPTFNTFIYMNMSNTINQAVSSAVRESINKANAQSMNSSGSGFGGGGFSSGGGFGGGGGGGGRF